MRLEEIKARAEKCNQIIYETWGITPVSADSDFEWLIARVERLEKVAKYTAMHCLRCSGNGCDDCELGQLFADLEADDE